MVTGSAATRGTSAARFAAQRSCIRADNLARVSTESFRLCRPDGTEAAVCSGFPRIKALFGNVLEAARFTLRINLERRLASFCMLASSFSSFRLKLFSVIIYNSSFCAMLRGNRARRKAKNYQGGDASVTQIIMKPEALFAAVYCMYLSVPARRKPLAK